MRFGHLVYQHMYLLTLKKNMDSSIIEYDLYTVAVDVRVTLIRSLMAI